MMKRVNSSAGCLVLAIVLAVVGATTSDGSPVTVSLTGVVVDEKLPLVPVNTVVTGHWTCDDALVPAWVGNLSSGYYGIGPAEPAIVFAAIRHSALKSARTPGRWAGVGDNLVDNACRTGTISRCAGTRAAQLALW